MNPLVEKFGHLPMWVTWKLVNKGGKKTKLPFMLNGAMASSTDPLTWVTYNTLKEKSLPMGIVLPLDQTILAIDIDKILVDNQINHECKEVIEKLLKEAKTYVEYSPSGTGLHLFFVVTDGIHLTSNRKAPYEAYTSGRYFTVTEKPYGEIQPIRTISRMEAEELLKIIGYPWNKLTKVAAPSFLSPVSRIFEDDEILSKMFKSKNGMAIKALYDGNTGNQGGDVSRADASFLAHLAFWTQKNAQQMERIWLQSPLGQREKTQKRADYRSSSVSNAIGRCVEVYTHQERRSVAIPDSDGEIEFLTTTKKVKDDFIVITIQNTENIARILRHDSKFAGRFRYDIFRNTIEIFKTNVWRLQEMNDAVYIQTEISIKYPEFAKVSKDMVADAIMLVSKENIFDSAVDYIKSCVWDGEARLNYWLQHTYGVEDNEYHRAVGSNWLKGLVKRLIEPGCKFDYVLVLEGEQGAKKSMSLATLGGQWHVETAMSTDNKDFYMQFQGKAIIEFSEGETLNRTEVKKMKAIITTQIDKYRPPYERLSQDFPRRCVFAMTTNESEYLKDETGNRRWLPVKLIKEEADIAWLSTNRDQLFAEAYHRLVVDNESVHEFPKEATKDEQAKRRIYDPNTDAVVEWYLTTLTETQREEGITIMDVYNKVINKSGNGKAIDRWIEMNIGGILKETLKLEKKRVMTGGLSSSRYFNVGRLLISPKDELDAKSW